MSKKISKIFTYLLLTVLAVVGLGNVANSVAEAAGPTTNVVIHKIETDATAAGREYDISQPITNLREHFGQAAGPLEGVSFTYYSVTADQLKFLTANPESYDTVALVDEYLEVNTGKTTDETDENGKVTISDLADGNYWVVENTKGTIKDSAAVPFGLTLPFTKADGTGYYETIHVYPKNTLHEPDVPVKTVDKSNNAIGEVHTWTITQNIPKGIEEYDVFKFTDAIDSRLDWVGKVTVTAAGVELGAGDYTVVFNDAENQSSDLLPKKSLTGILTVDFKKEGLAKLADATGPIEITFDTKINDTASMGEPIENNVQVDFNNGHGDVRDGKKYPTDKPKVFTGGKLFVKKDLANDLELAGAKFIVKVNSIWEIDSNGDKVTDTPSEEDIYVVVGDNGKISYTKDKNLASKSGFVSAEDSGLIDIEGLPFGDYTLIEIEAPEGYALPTTPVSEFVVNKGSYTIDPDNSYIDNKKITIPQTGGMGTAIFTVIGVALMTISVVSYKRTSEA